MDLREIGWHGMDWIDLAEDRGQCRALVDMVMNVQVPYNVGNFLIAEQLVTSQEGLSSVKLVS
jgi:hypothetical protein